MGSIQTSKEQHFQHLPQQLSAIDAHTPPKPPSWARTCKEKLDEKLADVSSVTPALVPEPPAVLAPVPPVPVAGVEALECELPQLLDGVAPAVAAPATAANQMLLQPLLLLPALSFFGEQLLPLP